MSKSSSNKVGVIGLGTVGRNVAERLINRAELLRRKSGTSLQLSAVAEPNMPSGMDQTLSDVTQYSNASELIENENCDIVVELIGGVNPAFDIIMSALRNGMDVVTANKELLAKKGRKIFETARRNECRIRFEASAGGSIPIVRTLRESLTDTDLHSIYGIINGTANYVLTRMTEDNQEFQKALNIAQDKGYAEADPSYDVEGDDSAHKLALLTALGFGTHISLEQIHCGGITKITPEIIDDAKTLGYQIKLLGIAKKTDDKLDVRVHPTLIPVDSALTTIRNEYNAILCKGEPVGSTMLSGKGAGGAPTATAIISDIISVARQDTAVDTSIYFSENDLDTISINNIETRYYIRLKAEDRPGVLSKVTSALGDNGISINSVIQHGRSEEDHVPIVLTTHKAKEGNVNRAIQQISALDVIGESPRWLRIEETL